MYIRISNQLIQFCLGNSYVPLKIDYTDLYDLMAFFSGDLDGNGGHDELAKQIAYNGKDWTENHWRMEDMEVCKCCFSLYLPFLGYVSETAETDDYELS